jgi:cobalt/nickel transport system permease protein
VPFKTALQRIPRWMILYYGLLAGWLATTAMHIPDGYLSPVTCAILFLLVLPFWVRGVQMLRQKMNARNIPLIALMAALSFVIMMFNVPLPGGSTGHAVGGALIAVLLGPEIATMAISIALLIQAVFFGDGGILAFGANCFNMAVVLPYVTYAVYQAFTRGAPTSSVRRVWGAALGGYLGLTVSAFFASVEFGIQPMLFHTADGVPLYAPYPLSISIPAMVVPHMLAASLVEAVVTAAVVGYLQRANQSALEMAGQPQFSSEVSGFARWRVLWIGLAVLIVATPIGLLAPGTAWGEWSSKELASRGLAFIPMGMEKLSGLWTAPAPGYNVSSLGSTPAAYILSAAVGILIIAVVVWLFTLLVTGGKASPNQSQSG